jgi:hypothetical protein
MTTEEMFERIHSAESFSLENVRRSFAASFAAAGLVLTGCATDMSKYYEVQGKAIEADNNAVMGLAAAAATGNQGAIMALALRQGSAGKIAPPQDKALVWASVLIPSLTQLYGINRNSMVQVKQIEAETTQYGATLGTIGAISIKGMEEAGTVVFPPVYTVPLGSAPAPAVPAAPAVAPVATP